VFRNCECKGKQKIRNSKFFLRVLRIFLLRNRPECPYLNTRMRSSSGLNVFSPGSPAGVPNGICAISLHSSGRLQRLRTSLSISGL